MDFVLTSQFFGFQLPPATSGLLFSSVDFRRNTWKSSYRLQKAQMGLHTPQGHLLCKYWNLWTALGFCPKGMAPHTIIEPSSNSTRALGISLSWPPPCLLLLAEPYKLILYLSENIPAAHSSLVQFRLDWANSNRFLRWAVVKCGPVAAGLEWCPASARRLCWGVLCCYQHPESASEYLQTHLIEA